MMLQALEYLGVISPKPVTPSTPHTATVVAHPVVTDLTVRIFSPPDSPSTCELDPRIWHRIEKDLHLYASHQSAWLYVALANEEKLAPEDLVVVDIRVGEPPPNTSPDCAWESRHGGIWVRRRSKSSCKIDQAVTGMDVLFGIDAVDPRPQWALMQSPLQLNTRQDVPVARLSVLHGRAKPRSDTRPTLRVRADGTFKIVQISDTHMVTGVGVCKDAIDADGRNLPESEADPLTVDFIGKVLDAERPDLVVFTGDQLHHGIRDSQSALFKVVAPVIERSIPFAAVFGNHDSEGDHALSRTAQMSILQNLPFSLCEPGLEQVDGIGNFYLQVLAPAPSRLALATLYLLDSHGEIPSRVFSSGYDHIKQSQIEWFLKASQAQRSAREKNNDLSIAFLHIPLPEFKDRRLVVRGGRRREPTEGPSCNSHFYDALVKERISALGCGHDHVNDFCALLPQEYGDNPPLAGPWLCYGGGSGFGGYCSYGKSRFHRRTRTWQFDTNARSLKTWKRVEYASDRVDELVLVKGGAVVNDLGEEGDGRSCAVS
ncbi:Metallo-dependent phosphatase-like protein [Massariosphaeria phaeospora]|uniref:Metallo-dependent phosphatase-like protein n=1 Tax=Massariosphaeria phaeospora TaxID=100035 RepID=A0A7C8M2U8_9PLEO|nr:Metallo-dependent phosphatase-like protein [Massariosphaeria phaeospora]